MAASVFNDPLKWPFGETELAALIRNHDWAATSLGPIENWPQSLRTLVDICLAHPLPCAIVCGQDRVLIYNDPCALLQGDAHPRALGAAAALAFPEALSDAGPIHERLLAGEPMIFRKRPWVFQCKGVLKTGHYDAFFTPVRSETGTFSYVLAMILDAPANDAAPSGQTSATQASAPDALWILDIGRMRLEFASQALERLMGEGRARVLSDFRRWFDLVHPDDVAAVKAHMAQSVAAEASVMRYRIVRLHDGSTVTVRHTSFAMPGTDAAQRRVIGLLQDVTAIERISAALLEEKERYRTLAEGISPLVWRSCDQGLWTWAGPQWLNFTGQTQEQSQGWGWLDVIHPDDRDATMQAWHQARPHGVLNATFRLLRASDQTWRWHQTQSLPRRAESRPGEPEGGVIEWLGSSVDIHELWQLNAQQDALISELEQRTASTTGVARALGALVP